MKASLLMNKKKGWFLSLMNRLILRLRQLKLLLIVIGYIHINKVLIHSIPFKTLLKWYTRPPFIKRSIDVRSDFSKIVRYRIQYVVKKLPWKAICFEQALTALAIARLYNLDSVVHFGICKDEKGQMKAHAWSQIGNVMITGYQNAHEYTEVYKMTYSKLV